MNYRFPNALSCNMKARKGSGQRSQPFQSSVPGKKELKFGSSGQVCTGLPVIQAALGGHPPVAALVDTTH